MSDVVERRRNRSITKNMRVPAIMLLRIKREGPRCIEFDMILLHRSGEKHLLTVIMIQVGKLEVSQR